MKTTGEKFLRREISKISLKNKIAIVTGGAQGFGAGIAESLYALKINVVVADLNEETGTLFVSGLNKNKSSNQCYVMLKRMSLIRIQLKNLLVLTM